jgi:hypothetical protein
MIDEEVDRLNTHGKNIDRYTPPGNYVGAPTKCRHLQDTVSRFSIALRACAP